MSKDAAESSGFLSRIINKICVGDEPKAVLRAVKRNSRRDFQKPSSTLSCRREIIDVRIAFSNLKRLILT